MVSTERSYPREYSCEIFKKWVKVQGQSHRVKNNGTHKRSYHREYSSKISSSGTHCSKVISKVKVSKKNESNSKVKVTGLKIMVSTERSYHREYSCEISKLYHSLFKSY